MKTQPNRWLIFSGLFIQIALIMYVLTNVGKRAELYFGNQDNHITLALSIIGIILIIFLIINQTKNLK